MLKIYNTIIDIKYLYLVLIVLIFYLYGLIISEIIDYIFPDFDDNVHDIRIILEIVGEIGVAYLIYFSLRNYSKHLINILYNNISKKPPYYLNQLLLIAFSTGIYKYLQKSTHKMTHIKQKYVNYETLINFVNNKYK